LIISQEYSRGQPLLSPFFPLFFPFIVWFRRRLREEERKEMEEDAGLKEETERDKLISVICDRYTRKFTQENDCQNDCQLIIR
jgi:hypothetical protein